MKYSVRLLIIFISTVVLCSCGNSKLEPREVFSEIERLISSAAVTLEGVEDGKSAHQASQKLAVISEELDDVVLRVKPFDRMTALEAEHIIEGFGRGRSAMVRLGEAVNKNRSNRDHWIVLETSVANFGKSIEKATIVMRSYIEALPTQ